MSTHRRFKGIIKMNTLIKNLNTRSKKIILAFSLSMMLLVPAVAFASNYYSINRTCHRGAYANYQGSGWNRITFYGYKNNSSGPIRSKWQYLGGGQSAYVSVNDSASYTSAVVTYGNGYISYAGCR